MNYRVKESAPQVVKDLEAEPETIDVVERNGRQVAVATWRDQCFEEELPRGCEAWEGDEVKSVMKNTARRLKVRVAKAKWQAMADIAEAACKSLAPEELEESDFARIAQAEAKRQRRAAKRARYVQ